MVSLFQGAIIAAGHGARLRATSGVELPKPLVEVGGTPLLLRQARAMLAAGACEVLTVINSETAALARGISLPASLKVTVRDTESSMESLFVLGELLRPGHFLLATVDAMVPQGEFDRFVKRAREMTTPGYPDRVHGALAVVKWRGDEKPLFTEVTKAGLITSLGQRETSLVTAGMYWLPTEIFGLAEEARRRKLGAMRSFLQMVIEQKFRLGAVEVEGVIDVDEANDLEAARRTFAGQP